MVKGEDFTLSMLERHCRLTNSKENRVQSLKAHAGCGLESESGLEVGPGWE